MPDTGGLVETVFAWSNGRRLHVLTREEIGGGRRAAVAHTLRRASDVSEVDRALGRIFHGRAQRRIPNHAGSDLWFEVR